MRILVHDHAGHPFQAQLSRELARRGHVVLHAFKANASGRSGALKRLENDPDTLTFKAIRLGPRADVSKGLLNRLRHEIIYARRASSVVDGFRPDVLISSNTPLFVQRQLLHAARRQGGSFVYWMQDLISASQIRRLRRRPVLIRRPAAAAVRWLERSSLVGADAVVAVTPDFASTLRAYGVPHERVTIVANWSPLDEIAPVERDNEWAIEHGLGATTVFLYAGSLGLKHDPGLLIELARAVPDALVVVVAEGAGADFVRDEAVRLGLDNVRVLPSQPYERLSEVLGTADVLVAILDRDAGAYSVPSKILSYLCAGRAILASVPRQNLAAQVVTESGGGVVVEPGSIDEWTAAARMLAGDEQQRMTLADRGRTYAQRTFDIRRIGDQFEEVVERAVAAART